jgi:excinuclease UvrABC ATPase subunit
MGMLYVPNEASIGLHLKDNVTTIATLKSLRDTSNTVIVEPTRTVQLTHAVSQS